MRPLLILLAILAAGCGLTQSRQAPSECGISAEVELIGAGSLTAFHLQDYADPTFPDDGKGPLYVTEPNPEGRRTYCIQLDAGTDDVWTHSGLAPAGWDPPSD